MTTTEPTQARDPAVCYHPDPDINRDVIADAIEAERADLAAGFPPRRWRCICGTEQSRGHVGAIGVHRCLACGYVGTEGVMFVEGEEPTAPPEPEPIVLEMRPVRLWGSPLYGCRRCHVLAMLHLWRLYRRHLRHLAPEKPSLIPAQLPQRPTS